MTTTVSPIGPLTTANAPHYPLVDSEWGEDLLDGIPPELLQQRGAMDVDTAGGCG